VEKQASGPGTAALDFVDAVNSISKSAEFEHFDPDELVPTLEALDAVSNGPVNTPGRIAPFFC